jgi:ribosomal protein S11
MKKLAICVLAFAIAMFAITAFAASKMDPHIRYYISPTENVRVIRVICTADSDGTFTSFQLDETGYTKEYQKQGYALAHAWAVNSATNDHTNAAVVTITDETGQVIIGAASGDTLTLSTAASGIALMVADRASAQRSVTSKLTIAIADTGSTATVQTLYLLLRK